MLISFFSEVLLLFRMRFRLGVVLVGMCSCRFVLCSWLVKCLGLRWLSRLMVGMFSDCCRVLVMLIGLEKFV